MHSRILQELEEIRIKLADGKSPNIGPGLIMALHVNTGMDYLYLVDKVIEAIKVEDLSILKFKVKFCSEMVSVDLSNDIKNLADLKRVVFNKGVVWRSYLGSDNKFSGLLFGDGKFLGNFRGYGFQLSGNMNGDFQHNYYFTGSLDEIINSDISRETKLELLRPVIRNVSESLYSSYRDEIEDYLRWFVSFSNCYRDEYIPFDYLGVITWEREFGTRCSLIDYDWSLLENFEKRHKKIEHNSKYFIPMQLKEDGLYINGEKCLSVSATKFILQSNKPENHFKTFFHSKYPDIDHYFLYFVRKDGTVVTSDI